MQNLLQDLKELLQNDEKLIVEGELVKNKIVELTLQSDPELIKLLLKNENIKKHFFINVEGILIFDKHKFQKLISNKQFLPDSYTAFKNKMGLVIDDETNSSYISNNNEIVLAWPHKDCILEGAQTKEDQKRNEVFWNETLVPENIDRLLAPKVFTNFRVCDENGERKAVKISGEENLILKGNNLLCLYSLLETHAERFKLIYIDPPYNTGSDSFNYNDSFNQSSWLTFMKNRLEVARKLLANDGAIFIHIDHHQLGYLNVLMDEIFGRDNKVQIISVKTASPAGFKTVNPGPIDVTEYILFYTKNKASYNFKKGYVPVGYNKNYNLYVEKKANVDDWIFVPIKQKVLEKSGLKNEKEAKTKYGDLWKRIYPVLLGEFALENAENVVSVRDPHKPTDKVKGLMEKSKKEQRVLEYKREDGSTMYIYKGGALAFYSNKLQEVDGERTVTELLTDFWSHISWAGIAKEGGVKLKNGKKPEKLIKQILDLTTEQGDWVMDFHLGSGTTTAVAHKMHRRYVGIEQLDYGINDSVKRMENVIMGDMSGISKSVSWNGGGSFVYAELAKLNQLYVEKIESANKVTDIVSVWKEMEEEAMLSYAFESKDFEEKIKTVGENEIEELKKYMVEILDKNMLYVNLSEMEDDTYKICNTDKELNRQFYNL